MKTAAVIIDDWKLSIFEKHLTGAGYSYEKYAGLTHGTLVVRVSYEWVAKLKPVIEAAAKECAEVKR